jgi:Bax protein
MTQLLLHKLLKLLVVLLFVFLAAYPIVKYLNIAPIDTFYSFVKGTSEPEINKVVNKSTNSPLQAINPEFIQQIEKLIVHYDIGEFSLSLEQSAINLKPTFEIFDPIPNFAAISDVKTKKQLYFKYIKTAAQDINAVISLQRQFVLVNMANTQSIKDESIDVRAAWAFLLQEYHVQAATFAEQRKQLLAKINLIPVSLVQVQTANESGWGTSRFAVQGYNFFGLWCYKKGCGFVPLRRDYGASHEVAKFNSLPEAMYAYIRNLNRNNAYQAMRDIRTQYIDLADFDLAYEMVRGLHAYSQRGDAYIEELHAMLRVNKELL